MTWVLVLTHWVPFFLQLICKMHPTTQGFCKDKGLLELWDGYGRRGARALFSEAA